jgi:hypothetical protein
MSTRGCVAIGTPHEWRGVYNHWDSYPTGLGQEVWVYLQTLLAQGGTLDTYARELLSYDDWRAYCNRGTCEYCGRKTSQPHSISGVICLRKEEFKTQEEMRRYYQSLPAWRGRDAEVEEAIGREWQIRQNVELTGYPDPQVEYHEHDTRPAKEQHITSENPDPLFIEWVYVIDPATGMFHILNHNGQARRTVPLDPGEWCRKEPNGGWNYGHCIYWHELVTSLPLAGPEPDWEALEKREALQNDQR